MNYLTYCNLSGLLCILLLVCIKKYKRISSRTCWTETYLKGEVRSNYGSYSTVFRYFKIKDADEFYNFVEMSVADFNHFCMLVTPRFLKKSHRKPLEPELKLAAVLKLV